MTDSRIDGMPETKFSAPFREMAERVERNIESEFAGAILIVPPEGDPIAVMVADPSKSLEAFWAQAKQRIDVAVNDFVLSRGGQNANWPGRR